jgi:hypothetical protein
MKSAILFMALSSWMNGSSIDKLGVAPVCAVEEESIGQHLKGRLAGERNMLND